MTTSRRTFLSATTTTALAAPFMGAGRLIADFGGQNLRPKRAGETVLAFAGDLFPTPFPKPTPRAVEEVFDVFRSADAAFANLEGGLSTTGSPELGGYKWGGPVRGHPSLAAELTALGIDAVSLANNHTCNYGHEALLETITTLDRTGIKHAGAGRNIDEAFAPVFVTANGLKIAFFSLYSCHYGRVSREVAGDSLPGVACVRAYDVLMETPGAFASRVQSTVFDPKVNPRQLVMAPLAEDVQRLTSAIAKARPNADRIVLYVHFHWARHTKPGLPFHQRVVAHAAVDAGVDLFVGHGPHVLRGVEVYNGRPVLYSTGNFVLPPRATSTPGERAVPLTEQSMVTRVILGSDKSIDLEFLPIVFQADGQPRFARDTTGAGIVQRLRALSSEFDLEIAQNDWYGSVRIAPVAAASADADSVHAPESRT